jgi:hypothetical protein
VGSIANNQGELSPLEYGLHALHCVPMGKVGAGRGNKDGLSEYARTVSREESTLRAWRKAATVYENSYIKNSQLNANFKPADFISIHTALTAIHAAPSESWPALCQYLLTAQDVTVSKISGKAKELAELNKSIPEWWIVDFASLSPSVIADQQYAQRMTSLFQYVTKQESEFSEHTFIYVPPHRLRDSSDELRTWLESAVRWLRIDVGSTRYAPPPLREVLSTESYRRPHSF